MLNFKIIYISEKEAVYLLQKFFIAGGITRNIVLTEAFKINTYFDNYFLIYFCGGGMSPMSHSVLTRMLNFAPVAKIAAGGGLGTNWI